MLKRQIKIVKYKVTHLLKPISKLMIFIVPYVMYYIGKGKIVFDSNLFIPIIIYCIASIIRRVSDIMIGIKEDTFPTPRERFTTVNEDGEASVKDQRIYELIIYVAEVEDWLQNKGLL